MLLAPDNANPRKEMLQPKTESTHAVVESRDDKFCSQSKTLGQPHNKNLERDREERELLGSHFTPNEQRR